jgi:putative peptidoglycan lipid II flippase
VNRESLIKSVALMMLAALVGKVLLVIREPIVAAYFGASAQTDAYNVAMAVIAMLVSVSLSPVGSALVPVYVERLHQDDVLARRFVRQVFALYLLIVSSVLLVAYLAAPLLVRLYAPGFDAPTSELAERLTRILGLFAVFSGLAGYFGQVLTAHEGFLWVALGPVATAVIVVVILLVAGPGPGIDVLAWGVVAGNAAHAFILGLSARRQAGGLGIDVKLGEAIQALAKLSGWMLVGRLVGQGNTLIDRNMLSFLSAGSIAALGFARSIYLLRGSRG